MATDVYACIEKCPVSTYQRVAQGASIAVCISGYVRTFKWNIINNHSTSRCINKHHQQCIRKPTIKSIVCLFQDCISMHVNYNPKHCCVGVTKIIEFSVACSSSIIVMDAQLSILCKAWSSHCNLQHYFLVGWHAQKFCFSQIDYGIRKLLVHANTDFLL